jgi:hypothetical protein
LSSLLESGRRLLGRLRRFGGAREILTRGQLERGSLLAVSPCAVATIPAMLPRRQGCLSFLFRSLAMELLQLAGMLRHLLAALLIDLREATHAEVLIAGRLHDLIQRQGDDVVRSAARHHIHIVIDDLRDVGDVLDVGDVYILIANVVHLFVPSTRWPAVGMIDIELMPVL